MTRFYPHIGVIIIHTTRSAPPVQREKSKGRGILTNIKMLSNLQMTLQFWQQMALPTFCITSGTQHVSTIVFSAYNSITHSCQQKRLLDVFCWVLFLNT